MKKSALGLLLAVCSIPCFAQTPILNSCSGMSLGPNGALNGFVPAPGDAWHQDISAAPIDPQSATIIATNGDLGGSHLHPDFSSVAGGNYGIPYEVVDSSKTPGVPVRITLYPSESDITIAPIPANTPIEGAAPGACVQPVHDYHVLVLDRNKCVAYEYWQGSYCNSSWTASNTALFDMSITTRRPYTFTSADAAGLSIFAGLLRYDEIVAGSVNHAIRFTALHTKNNSHNGFFVAPATHAAGNLWGTDNIIGMRIRLRADFDISGYSLTNRIILTAMKKYGMILADNGSNLFFQGTPDARWDDNDLSHLKAILSTAFDVIAMGTRYDASTAPQGAAPTLSSFRASANNITAGSPVTLTANVTNASISFIDNAGFYRAPIVVNPTATTTYKLTSRNEFGSTSASVTVTVGKDNGNGNGQNLPVPALQLSFMSAGAAKPNQFWLSAGSPSGGAITYSIASGPGSLNQRTLSFSAPGTVLINAQQAATTTYAAGQASLSIVWAGTASSPSSGNVSTLRISAMAGTTNAGKVYWLSTTSNSPAVVTYSIVSGPGSLNQKTLMLSSAGTVVVQAHQAATSAFGAGSTTLAITGPASK